MTFRATLRRALEQQVRTVDLHELGVWCGPYDLFGRRPGHE
jgi:hypothetical protein